ncbi:IclR family transcriptional regulator [Brevundimonas sp.]|uniref:IclR family transcriptional regulator n=1 Tax=Brevundimonas sp. TaxID=1871086 RepID=UPI0025BFC694|nr:IclR family transcriptional regulator [Brevundimonas sp.]MCG2663414.1 IclR family transcriptional regulator [Brevundimonas sp.]
MPATFEKGLDLLTALVADDGQSALVELAAGIGLPASTAHRFGAALERRGLIARERPGRYLAGPRLVTLLRVIDEGRVLARLSRRALRQLARRCRQTVHMGVLEDDMVTYIAKEAGGSAAAFTRENMQLEAYCTGIGKVLLAALPEGERDRYLSEGPFVALTPHTVIDPKALRQQLDDARHTGWAIDEAEIFDDLKCIASPVRRSDGTVVAAPSVSAPASAFTPQYRQETLAALRETIATIEDRFAA